jgi:hypothetical protein
LPWPRRTGAAAGPAAALAAGRRCACSPATPLPRLSPGIEQG